MSSVKIKLCIIFPKEAAFDSQTQYTSRICPKYDSKDFNKFIKQLIVQTTKNIQNKIEKSSKTAQDKKSLASTFACFFTALAKI